jgi:pilus assembly protein CpaF
MEMLQAMNTGHDGGIGTIHANSTRDALARLETMVLMVGTDLPSRAVREQIVSAINLLVHVRRYDDGVRRIESVAEITGLEGLTPQMQELFLFRRRGKQGRRVVGHFTGTGVIPRMVDELREEGVQVPSALFKKTEDADS